MVRTMSTLILFCNGESTGVESSILSVSVYLLPSIIIWIDKPAAVCIVTVLDVNASCDTWQPSIWATGSDESNKVHIIFVFLVD